MASSKEVSKVFDTPPPTKKVRKVSTKKVRKVSAKKVQKVSAKASTKLRNPATPTLQLMSLNYYMLEKLLQYLDVQVRLLRGCINLLPE